MATRKKRAKKAPNRWGLYGDHDQGFGPAKATKIPIMGSSAQLPSDKPKAGNTDQNSFHPWRRTPRGFSESSSVAENATPAGPGKPTVAWASYHIKTRSMTNHKDSSIPPVDDLMNTHTDQVGPKRSDSLKASSPTMTRASPSPITELCEGTPMNPIDVDEDSDAQPGKPLSTNLTNESRVREFFRNIKPRHTENQNQLTEFPGAIDGLTHRQKRELISICVSLESKYIEGNRDIDRGDNEFWTMVSTLFKSYMGMDTWTVDNVDKAVTQICRKRNKASIANRLKKPKSRLSHNIDRWNRIVNTREIHRALATAKELFWPCFGEIVLSHIASLQSSDVNSEQTAFDRHIEGTTGGGLGLLTPSRTPLEQALFMDRLRDRVVEDVARDPCRKYISRGDIYLRHGNRRQTDKRKPDMEDAVDGGMEDEPIDEAIICSAIEDDSETEAHESITNTSGRFQCKLCSKAFNWKSSLKRHEREYHTKGPKRAKIECPFCAKRYWSQQGLRHHLNTKHDEPVTSRPLTFNHECPHCQS